MIGRMGRIVAHRSCVRWSARHVRLWLSDQITVKWFTIKLHAHVA
jgi:hypothetical protein